MGQFGLRGVRDDILLSAEEKSAARFRPIGWAQISLPLLGFLGTIVGIGEAMAKISQELLRGSANTIVLEDGFNDVALAFETTFLGLAGLLILTAGEEASTEAE